MDGEPLRSGNTVNLFVCVVFFTLLSRKKKKVNLEHGTSGIWEVCIHAKREKPQEGELYFIVRK